MDKRIFFKYPKLLNLYPPFLGAGIRVKSLNATKNRFQIDMKLRWYNQNVYGTHFGGSLYAMCDPFFVFIVYHYLGDGYIIWDKAASIEFKRPGRGKVSAVFEISLERLAEIKELVERQEVKTFTFEAQITDQQNETVAKLEKVVYIRKKRS